VTAPIVALDPGIDSDGRICNRGRGLVVFPTDTVYGLGPIRLTKQRCEMSSRRRGGQQSRSRSSVARPRTHRIARTESEGTSARRANIGPVPKNLDDSGPLKVKVPRVCSTRGTGTLGVRVPPPPCHRAHKGPAGISYRNERKRVGKAIILERRRMPQNNLGIRFSLILDGGFGGC